ncbi:hypothetical protein RIR_jg38181.t1 [Rhizophagus irregularis DAOM 181602=DAOM 197198]|uniref:Uncharacterized protein n=1 Tax=Rhizophagus irregularis (strain DAOM 181602 / DAOM 197198 / MUCL 43194) TaxID=747089 RepID=U9U485_RHIID|nr:hypothetical protein RIR_jg38181.t1 [Rhizophagus irregularis DAOM 181602=DAOM 197198]
MQDSNELLPPMLYDDVLFQKLNWLDEAASSYLILFAPNESWIRSCKYECLKRIGDVPVCHIAQLPDF